MHTAEYETATSHRTTIDNYSKWKWGDSRMKCWHIRRCGIFRFKSLNCVFEHIINTCDIFHVNFDVWLFFLLRFFFYFQLQCVECNFLWELNQMPFHICMKNIRHRAASIEVHIYNCLVFAVSSFIHRTRNIFDITQTTQRCVCIWLLWGVV